MAYGNTLYSIWLAEKFPYGSPVPGKLLSAFRTAERVYLAKREDYLEAGFLKGDVRGLEGKSLQRAEEIAEECMKAGITAISYNDGVYPEPLRYTEAPPAVIYVRGILPSFSDNVFISAVGTRSMTDQGRAAAHRLCFDMAAAGAIIISGMAKGVDSWCHRGAIDGGGITLAVLGAGCDVIYPPENEALMAEIIRNGAVISEYPPKTPPAEVNFPIRNRLIAALSSTTVVVEAGIGSGALITARYALDYGKELFAVPGAPSNDASKGVNELIKRGVKVATEASDILAQYELSHAHRISLEGAAAKRYFVSSIRTEEEDKEEINEPESFIPGASVNRASELEGANRIIYEALMRKGAMSPEELAAAGVPSSEAVYRLTLLEIAGYVTVLPGGKYTVK